MCSFIKSFYVSARTYFYIRDGYRETNNGVLIERKENLKERVVGRGNGRLIGNNIL